MGTKRARGNSVTERLQLPPRLPDFEDDEDIIIQTQQRATSEQARTSPKATEVAEPASETREAKRHQRSAPRGEKSGSDNIPTSTAPTGSSGSRRVKPRQPPRQGQKHIIGNASTTGGKDLVVLVPDEEETGAAESTIPLQVVDDPSVDTISRRGRGDQNTEEVPERESFSDDSGGERSARTREEGAEQAESDEEHEDDEDDDDTEEDESESSSENAKGKGKSGGAATTRNTPAAKTEVGYYCDGSVWMFNDDNPKMPAEAWIEKVLDSRIGRWQVAVSNETNPIGD